MSFQFTSPVSVADSEMHDKRIQIANELAKIDADIEAARKEHRRPIIDAIRAAIIEHKIVRTELYPAGEKNPFGNSSSFPPKYRDPISQKEWSGRGNVPGWIKGRDRSDFLITTEPASQPVTATDDPNTDGDRFESGGLDTKA